MKRGASALYIRLVQRFAVIVRQNQVPFVTSKRSTRRHVQNHVTALSAASSLALLPAPARPFCSRPANSMGRESASLAPPDRDIQHHLAAEYWAAPVLISINHRRKPAKSIKTTAAIASLRRALSPDILFAPQSRP